MSNGGAFISTPHHAGLVVADLEAAMDFYSQNFGHTFFQFQVNQDNSTLSGSSSTFLLRLGIGQLGLGLIELIQPVTGSTIYSRYLAQRGPGLHHLAYSVTDLVAARKRLTSAGCPCLQDGTIRGLVDFSYYAAPEMAVIVEPLQFSCDLPAFLVRNAQAYAPNDQVIS